MSKRPRPLFEGAIGVGGLLAPALLVSFVAASESGAITLDAAGSVVVSQELLWLSPLYLTLALLAVVGVTHLSALVLYRRALRQNGSAAAFYRRGAFHSGLVSGALALALLLALRLVTPDHFAALLGVWPLLVTIAAGWALALWTLRRPLSQRSSLAAVVAGLATWALAIVVFGLTRLPWLLYGNVRLDAALTPPAMFTVLMVTVALGVLILLPALAIFYMVLLRPAQPSPALTEESEQRERERTLVTAGS